MPVQPAYTAGPQSVALAAAAPRVIVPANPNRIGLILANGTSADIFIAIGAVDPTAKLYTRRLAAGEDWALPMYGAIQEVRAFSTVVLALTAGFNFTEFVLA